MQNSEFSGRELQPVIDIDIVFRPEYSDPIDTTPLLPTDNVPVKQPTSSELLQSIQRASPFFLRSELGIRFVVHKAAEFIRAKT